MITVTFNCGYKRDFGRLPARRNEPLFAKFITLTLSLSSVVAWIHLYQQVLVQVLLLRSHYRHRTDISRSSVRRTMRLLTFP